MQAKRLIFNATTNQYTEEFYEFVGPSLDQLKTDAKIRIKESFANAFNSGYTTQSLTTNFKVDCRREDLQNLQSLLTYMQTNSIPSTYVRGFDNDMHEVTVAELQNIVNELIAYGLWLYQHKWEKETEINNITQEQVDVEKTSAIASAQTAIDEANVMPRTIEEEILAADIALQYANTAMEQAEMIDGNIILNTIVW